MLDKTDISILDELKKDCKQYYSRIGDRLCIPRTTVAHRINKMVERKFIEKFSAIPNYKNIGLPVTVFLLISFKSGEVNSNGKTKVTQNVIAKKISQLHNVFEVHIITGEYDLLVKARGTTLDEIGKLVVDKIREIKGVGNSYTLACFNTVYEQI